MKFFIRDVSLFVQQRIGQTRVLDGEMSKHKVYFKTMEELTCSLSICQGYWDVLQISRF